MGKRRTTMEAVILAAGEGLRMRPLTNSMPKVMLRIANKPILEHALESLISAGIRDIVMVVGYRKEHIMSYFEDGKKWGVKIRYAHEEKQIGTAHALSKAKDMVSRPFIVYPGDNVISGKALEYFIDKAQEGKDSLLVVESAVPAKYGFVMKSGNKISGIQKDMEPHTGALISTGIYLFNSDIFALVERKAREGVHTLTDVSLSIIKEGGVLEAVVAPDRWMDAVYPWDILATCDGTMQEMEVKLHGEISQKATIEGLVHVGKDTIIREGCIIKGPTIIGEGCEIGPNVIISPSTAIGRNVRIEPFVKISHSIIMDDVSIGGFSSLDHSILAEGVVLEGHFFSICGRADIKTAHGFKEVGRIGSIVGEDTVIGPHVVAMPGTIVGAKCQVGPLVRLRDSVSNCSTVV